MEVIVEEEEIGSSQIDSDFILRKQSEASFVASAGKCGHDSAEFACHDVTFIRVDGSLPILVNSKCGENSVSYPEIAVDLLSHFKLFLMIIRRNFTVFAVNGFNEWQQLFPFILIIAVP